MTGEQHQQKICPAMDWLPLTLLSVAAFATTNLDDAFVLLLFFGDRRYRARHVFIGQALGVGLLVLLYSKEMLVSPTLPSPDGAVRS